MGTILLAVIGQTLFATIAGFWAAAMKRRWWVWVLVSLLLTPRAVSEIVTPKRKGITLHG